MKAESLGLARVEQCIAAIEAAQAALDASVLDERVAVARFADLDAAVEALVATTRVRPAERHGVGWAIRNLARAQFERRFQMMGRYHWDHALLELRQAVRVVRDPSADLAGIPPADLLARDIARELDDWLADAMGFCARGGPKVGGSETDGARALTSATVERLADLHPRVSHAILRTRVLAVVGAHYAWIESARGSREEHCAATSYAREVSYFAQFGPHYRPRR